MTVLVNPIMFSVLENRTYFLFAGLNLLWIPTVFFFYPETANRSLESIDALFLSSSPFNRAMERSYAASGNVLQRELGKEEAGRRLSELSISSGGVEKPTADQYVENA